MKEKICIGLLWVFAVIMVCGGVCSAAAEDPAQYAGEYDFYCGYLSPDYMDRLFSENNVKAADIGSHYVYIDAMAGEYIRLDEDGTGYLYWGEENQGPIDWWKVEDGKLQYKAGVANVEGTIEDGFMMIGLEDGLVLCFASQMAELPAEKPITMDEFMDLLYKPSGNDQADSIELTLFAFEANGYLVESSGSGFVSVLKLNDDRTGTLDMNGDITEIRNYSADQGKITLDFGTDGTYTGDLYKGLVIALDLYGDRSFMMYYKEDDADISGLQILSMKEYTDLAQSIKDSSLVNALWNRISGKIGAHLSYQMKSDYLDAIQTFDVHGKGGLYYSSCTTRVSGYESTSVSFCEDGVMYSLSPENMTAAKVTTVPSSVTDANIMVLDGLCREIYAHAQRTDFTQETREVDGVSYQAEIYPAADYQPEAVFYFDDDGRLVYCFEGAPVIETAASIGETFYTVYEINEAVDESLLNLSGYTIQ